MFGNNLKSELHSLFYLHPAMKEINSYAQELKKQIDNLKKEIESLKSEENSSSKKINAIQKYLDINFHEDVTYDYEKFPLKIQSKMNAAKIHRCKSCKQEVKS